MGNFTFEEKNLVCIYSGGRDRRGTIAVLEEMRGYLEAMTAGTSCPTVHTIQGAVKDSDLAAMEQIADELLG